MSAYEMLRREYTGVSPRDLAKIAMTSQWLVAGKHATLKETTRCVRALFLPAVSTRALADAAAFAEDHFGFASLDLLRDSMINASRGWVVEWNPDLTREYGLSGKEP
jgi:hypothetical protein